MQNIHCLTTTNMSLKQKGKKYPNGSTEMAIMMTKYVSIISAIKHTEMMCCIIR